MTPDPWTLGAVAAAAALVAGVLRTSIGGGLGLTLTPLMALVLPAPLVLGLIGLMALLSDPITLGYYWGAWDGAQMRLLVPGAVAGVLVGGWVLAELPERQLRHLIGAVALVLAFAQLPALLARAPRTRLLPWPLGVGVGMAGGLASVVAHSGGIVVAPYLAARGLSNAHVIGTGATVQAAANVVKLGTYWSIGFLGGPIVVAALATTPLLYLGAWLGVRLNRRLPRRAFALVLVALAVVGSLRLLLG